ncbi:MAG: SUMF1/EgtB/PvdO family nonheme iron enzyme [Deltaproteobacteria bacterium]|nr:SUMF1/EgtB/PvdO family nonheme iron enzyme [Deltaproteobacteria bacterium]
MFASSSPRSPHAGLLLAAVLAPLLGAKPSGAPAVQRVPSVEEVVEQEGFTPTPSQSEIYRPGAVLVPNAKGGHDVIVKDCLAVQAEVSVMAQSSIATSLATGVSARLGVAKGAAAAGIEKRLSFVDPEQRTIPLSQLAATEACTNGVKNAARFADLSRGIVIYDVLVAQIKNSVCTKADASGKVVTLAAAEAAAFSECVQESDAQVPLGYKAVPLAQLVAVGGAPVPAAAGGGATQGGGWSGSGGFGGAGDLAKQFEAAEKLKVELEVKLVACLKSEADKVRAQAKTDWGQLAPLVAKTDAAAKAAVKGYLEKFVSVYGAVTVRCTNDLGERSEVVAVAEVAQARAWLDAPAASAGGGGSAPSGDSGSRVVGSSGYALRLVPAGTYTVGCTAGQGSDCEDDEKPARNVTLSRAVLVGETEVTQGLYQRLMGSNPSMLKSCGSNCPVEIVSWYDVVKLANKLSAAEGLESCYVITGESVSWPKGPGCLGYRLPTEAEWEVAARGGGDAKHAGGNELSAVGWFAGNSGATPHPVGQKQANGYGLHDMSGNVWEWVWDWYDERAYAAGAVRDPLGPGSGSFRVARGGCWSIDPQYLRVAFRRDYSPGDRNGGLGVRLLRTAG